MSDRLEANKKLESYLSDNFFFRFNEFNIYEPYKIRGRVYFLSSDIRQLISDSQSFSSVNLVV